MRALSASEEADLLVLVREKRRREVDAMPLLDFVRYINPTFERPDHLAPFAAELERGFTESVEAGFSAPAQVGKSELIWTALARFMVRNPTKRNAYVTASAEFSERKSRTIQEYARRARVELNPRCQSASYWETMQGGSLLAIGIGGQFIGSGIDGWLVIDDPHRNRAEAESAVRREGVHSWFASAGGRLHPGASTYINHHRWHEDDLIGRLSNNEDAPFKCINLPAINPDGTSIWPSKRPIEWLENKRARVGEYEWESIWMGNPRPKGSKVFRDTYLYSERPKLFRVGIGIDCAYTSSTKSDRSVAIVLAKSLDAATLGKYFVLSCYSEQVEAPAFLQVLRGLMVAWPGAPMLWYGAGAERGIADFLIAEKIPLIYQPATADKFVRSQPTAADWNGGKILVPGGEGHMWDQIWVANLLSVVLGFTGYKDKRDDEVDALAAAHDALDQPAAPRGMGQDCLLPF